MIVTHTSSLLYTYFATKRTCLKPMWPLELPRYSCLLSGNEPLWTKRTSSFTLIYISGIEPHGQGTEAHIDRKGGPIGVRSGAEINDDTTNSYMSLLHLRFDISEAACALIFVIARPKSEKL